MNILKALMIFYQKLIIPTLLFSILINLIGVSITGTFSSKILGISYILLGLLFQYFIYELWNPNEYYFYFNIGLNKYILWMFNLFISLIVGIIISFIWTVYM